MPGPYNSYVDIFGGTPINPANSSYQSIELTEDNSPYVLVWPVTGTNSGQIVTNIINVTADEDNLFIQMPDATLMSVGQCVLFCNKGDHAFSIVDNDGDSIANVPVADGESDPPTSGSVFIYLIDNTTSGGTWDAIAFGALTGSVQASLLAGLGLIADIATGKLDTNMVVKGVAGPTYNVLPSLLNPSMSDRAKYINWTGGSGTIVFPTIANATAGFYFMTGNNTSVGASINLVTTDGALIDGQSSQILTLGQTSIWANDGANWFSLGLGTPVFFQPSAATFDLSPYAGSGTHTLTPAEASKTIIDLITADTPLTANLTLLWPQTPGFYIISNNVTNTPFVLNISTTGGTITTPLPIGATYIFYNDGTNMRLAPTGTPSGSIIFPNGSAGAPSIRFLNSASDGFYSVANGRVGATIAGTEVFEWDATGVTIAPPGSISLPALNFSAISSGGGGAYIDNTNNWIRWAFNGVDSVAMGQSFFGLRDGTNVAPALGFISEKNTGFYKSGAGSISTSILGTEKVLFDATGISTVNGTESAPSYSYLSSNVDGMYLAGSHINGFACNSILTATVEPHGIKTINGSLANPSYSFLNFDDLGFMTTGSNDIVAVCNGNEIISIETSGLVIAAGLDLFFTNPANTHTTSITAGASSVDTTYTLPLDYPTINGQPLISTDTGIMGWATSSFDATGIKVPDGSESNPSVSFSNLNNAGIWFDNIDSSLAFSYGGSKIFEITGLQVSVMDGNDFSILGGSFSLYKPGSSFGIIQEAPTMAASYAIVWPAVLPSPGDALRVTSVVGTTVTLEWSV